MNWLAYLSFAAVIAGTLGLFIAFGLLPLARWCNQLSLPAALLVYAAASVLVCVVSFTALGLAMGRPGPEYGPGYGIGGPLNLGFSILGGLWLGLLLLIGRGSERAMVMFTVLSVAFGWWLADEEPFGLCQLILYWVVGADVFLLESFSPLLRHISTVVFVVMCSEVSFSREQGAMRRHSIAATVVSFCTMFLIAWTAVLEVGLGLGLAIIAGVLLLYWAFSRIRLPTVKLSCEAVFAALALALAWVVADHTWPALRLLLMPLGEAL